MPYVGHGPDISYAQGDLDLGAIVAATPPFVGIRASFGTAGADDHFARNRSLSGHVPLLVLYHFAYPNINGGAAGAVREADTFCNAVGQLRDGEAVDLDWEEPYSGDPVAWVEAWWTEVERRLGVTRPKEWTYGSAATLSGLSRDPASKERHLWLALYPPGGGDPAHPPAPPPGFGAVDVWQHGSAMWAGKSTDDNYVYWVPNAAPAAPGGSMIVPRPGAGPAGAGIDVFEIRSDGQIWRGWGADLSHAFSGDQGNEVLATPYNGQLHCVRLSGSWSPDGAWLWLDAVFSDGTFFANELDQAGKRWTGWLPKQGFQAWVPGTPPSSQPAQDPRVDAILAGLREAVGQ